MPHNTDFLVLGATGSIGSAFVNALVRHKIPATILVRSRDKAERFFGPQPLLEIIQGDALDESLVLKVATGKKYIFHGISYPYDKWVGNVDQAIKNVITAASQNKALILFPGNIYNFGMTSPIFENTPPAPNTKKGAIRVHLENMLQTATKEDRCRVLILRLPDFFGPGVTNGLMQPIFAGALEGKTMRWLGRIDIPHQLVYINDAAAVLLKLVQRGVDAEFEVINYGGLTVPSIREWFQQIAEIAGTSPKIGCIPKIMFALLAPFNPMIREIREMMYLFNGGIMLNDDKLKSLIPDFQPHPMPDAIRETLDWFKANSVQN